MDIGDFLKLGWYVGRVTDVSRTGAAFEVESVSFLASSTLSRKWLLTAQQKRLTVISRDEAIEYAKQEDMSGVVSLLDDLAALRERWEAQPAVDATFPAQGQFVQCMEWYGRLLDVCVGSTRSFLVVESAKMLSRRGYKYETLEVQQRSSMTGIQQATQAEAMANIDVWQQAVTERIQQAQEILTSWHDSNN